MPSFSIAFITYLYYIGLLYFQFHTAELALYQVSLAAGRQGSAAPEPSTATPSPHLEILRAGVLSAKSMIDFYLSLPVGAEITFNNSEWIQMGFAFIVAAKLSVAATEPFLLAKPRAYALHLTCGGS
jgi:hypothetical protein